MTNPTSKSQVSRTSWAWLEVAAGRIRAGEPELETLKDYGYVPERGVHQAEQPGQATREVVAFHGTNAEAAGKILVEGFRKETFFAFRAQDAVGFGGPHLFVVGFSGAPDKWAGPPDWQFHLGEHIGPEKILASFDISVLRDNLAEQRGAAKTQAASGQKLRELAEMSKEPQLRLAAAIVESLTLDDGTNALEEVKREATERAWKDGVWAGEGGIVLVLKGEKFPEENLSHYAKEARRLLEAERRRVAKVCLSQVYGYTDDGVPKTLRLIVERIRNQFELDKGGDAK